MWPQESVTPDANKYLGLLMFCIIVIPSWCILFIFLYRRELQPIKGRLPMLSFLAQMCVLSHETYLCFQLLYGNQIPCGIGTLLIYITILPAVDCILARGYILYFVFHVTQERLALASEKFAHERAASQPPIASSEKDWEATQKDSSASSRESTLKWFLRNRYRVQRPFLSACLGTVLFLQLIYPVINAINHGDERGIGRDPGCGTEGNIVLGIEIAILIAVAIWIAVKLRNIHDAFFLKDELRLVSTISCAGVVVWMILSNVPVIVDFSLNVFEIAALYLFLIEHTVFIVTILVPLYRSFDPIMQYNENDKNNDEDVEKLKQIIQMVPGFESFRAFVTREFSVQNLLFYVDVRDFRAKYDPNVVDANSSRTKSNHLPTQPVADAAAVVTSTPTVASAPPATPIPSPAPNSPNSTSRGVAPQRATSMIATATTTTSIAARTSSGASASQPQPPRTRSTISTASSAILTTFPFVKKEKEKEKEAYTPQQLAEHNKRVLLNEANLQFEASRLFRKYIAFGAPLQVNLPDTCVTQLAQALGLNRDGSRARKKTERERDALPTSSFLSPTYTVTSSKQHHSVSTAPMPRAQEDIALNSIDITVESSPINYAMFNEAQAVILRLMAVDSFKRYKKSSDYEDLSRLIESDPLMKMGLGQL